MLDMKILNRRPKIMRLQPSYLLKFYAFKRVKKKERGENTLSLVSGILLAQA